MKTLGKKNKNYIQGIFHPKNPNKYKGTLPVIYRSSLELLSFRYLDNSQNVITWGSESVVVPYQSPKDGRLHRYFVDLVAEIKMKDSSIRKVLIEVKPEKQTKPPTITNRKKQSTIIYEKYNYAINCAKWDAARKYAEKKGYLFLIFNENHLK
jgi:hypothetical protein